MSYISNFRYYNLIGKLNVNAAGWNTNNKGVYYANCIGLFTTDRSLVLQHE